MLRPYVIINVAVTADGKMDTVERRGTAISSPADKARVDRLRADADAVMVGGHTLRDEDPKLTVKSAALQAERVARGLPPHPAKIGITSRLDLNLEGDFVTAGPARRILFTVASASEAEVAALRHRGVEVFPLGGPQVDLPAALAQLHTLGFQRVMVEGGGRLNFELLRQRLVDELQVYQAPFILGGDTAPTLAGGAGVLREAAIPLIRHRVDLEDGGGVTIHYQVV